MINILKFSNPTNYPSYSLVKKNFGFFFTQIVKEKELPVSKIEECLKTICKIPKTKKTEYYRQCNIRYFYKNKLQGTACKNVNRLNPFVRVHDKNDLMKWISEIIGLSTVITKRKISDIIYAPNTPIKGKLLNSFLNNNAVNTSYMNEKECYKYFGVKKWTAKSPPKLLDAYISSFHFIHWSFPEPTSEDIFKNQPTIETVPCRAGLLGDHEKIIFKHVLNKSYNVRKPTILDAGFYEQYEPGGKTKPLKKCSPLSGFDEFVHIPNQFSNVHENIFETFNT